MRQYVSIIYEQVLKLIDNVLVWRFFLLQYDYLNDKVELKNNIKIKNENKQCQSKYC